MTIDDAFMLAANAVTVIGLPFALWTYVQQAREALQREAATA